MLGSVRTAATGDVNRGGGSGAVGGYGCDSPAGGAALTRPAEAAFERLAQARNRAAASSWGAVALARLTTAENRPGRGVGVVHGGGGEAAWDSAGAWAASGRGAKLACNGMVCAGC